ncbi:MAG: LemA family protein, partial [Cyanobacteria bacterium P01_D01_bin.1]
MNSNNAIPEEWVPVVLEKASRLYQQQNQAYSLGQLQAAGSEVEIPPELMQQALKELKAEQAAATQAQQRKTQMLKIGGFAAVGLAIATALWTASVYNSLNAARSNVDGKWAQVENQMQRRADLIPQITQIAQGYAGHEKAVIEALGSAREAFLSAQTVAARQMADESMKSAIAQFQTFAANSQQLQSSE